MQDARDRYLRAKEASVQAAKEQIEGFTPWPDGSLAVRQALWAEHRALAEYVRTLKTFSDLVLYKRIPVQSSKPVALGA